MALSPSLVSEIETLARNYPERRAALIPALHRCQEELGGWISPQTMEDVAALFDLEPVEVYGVASFYPMFHLRPVGRHVVSVCHNISCDLRGAEAILARVCEVTRAPVHGTSADGKFTVETVECQGACANAPMIDVDGVYHEDLDLDKVARILTVPGSVSSDSAAESDETVPGTVRTFETYLLANAKAEGAHRLASYRERGGYRALEKVLKTPMPPADVIAEVKASGLRGRGGAGFPTGLKWSFMPDPAKDPRPRYLAVNADESEPGTCKDRVLMERDPHGLIEGCLIAAYAMRLSTIYVYVRGEYRLSYRRVQEAIDEARKAGLVGSSVMGSSFACEIHMHKGAGAYICGEETGLMESLEGKRGHPRPKPPFPAGFGLWGKPTTVNNVETLHNVPFIIDRGSSWFRSLGTPASTGNFLCCISGHVEKPGVYELPFGLTAREILDDVAGGVWKGRRLKAWFPGGSSTGLLPASSIDVKMDHDSVKAAGSMFGTGAMIVLDETACVVRASHVIARFYDHESCGQCSQCREGTQWLSQIFRRIEDGRGLPDDVATLESLSRGMAPAKTICALSDAAAIPTLAVIKHFREEIEQHIREKRCPVPGSVLSDSAAESDETVPGTVSTGAVR